MFQGLRRLPEAYHTKMHAESLSSLFNFCALKVDADLLWQSQTMAGLPFLFRLLATEYVSNHGIERRSTELRPYLSEPKTTNTGGARWLAMFSTGGDLNPKVRVKLVWGVILGALGLVTILSNSIDAIKSIIALGAMPFVFIVLLLMVCLLKALKMEAR